MPVKKLTHKKEAKRKEPVAVGPLPDVFDEEAASPVVSKYAPTETEAEIEPVAAVEPRGRRVVTEEVEEEAAAPEPLSPPAEEAREKMEETIPEPSISKAEDKTPSFTIRENGVPVEQKLPAFLVDEEKKPEEDRVEIKNPEAAAATETMEAAVPQAYVGEMREVATEVKRERKGKLVTFFIILGMLLVAGGIIGLFLISTQKANETQVTPVVQATPAPTPEATPTVIVNTAVSSASASIDTAALKKDTKVNVLNGTSIKGLAAKEAAVLKDAGFTLGTVGNGSPADAGTIKVSSGKEALASEIQSALTGFKFTVSSVSGSAITVTLGEPTQ